MLSDYRPGMRGPNSWLAILVNCAVMVVVILIMRLVLGVIL